MTIARSAPTGDEPRCVVHLDHAGVPSAWTADLASLWPWHLAIKAAR